MEWYTSIKIFLSSYSTIKMAGVWGLNHPNSRFPESKFRRSQERRRRCAEGRLEKLLEEHVGEEVLRWCCFFFFSMVIAVISSYIHFWFWMEMFLRFFWHFLASLGWFYHQRWRSNEISWWWTPMGTSWAPFKNIRQEGTNISGKVGIWQPKGTSFIVLLLIWIPLESLEIFM